MHKWKSLENNNSLCNRNHVLLDLNLIKNKYKSPNRKAVLERLWAQVIKYQYLLINLGLNNKFKKKRVKVLDRSKDQYTAPNNHNHQRSLSNLLNLLNLNKKASLISYWWNWQMILSCVSWSLRWIQLINSYKVVVLQRNSH